MADILTPEEAKETTEDIVSSVVHSRRVKMQRFRASHEALRELVEDLAESLRDFGATQSERRGSMYRRAAEALDAADKALGRS